MSNRIGDLAASSTILWNDLFEKEADAFAASNRCTMKDLRTGLFAGGSGFTATDPLNCGTITSSGSVFAGAATGLGFTSRGHILAPSDGVWTLLNNAETGFTRIQIGGTTSSFPAIKRNSASIDFRLADDSGYCNLGVGAVTATDTIAAGAGFNLGWTGRSLMQSPADGTIVLYNNAATGFTVLKLGGTTSSFPALKRSGTGIQIRLADDSAYADIALGNITVTGVASIGTTPATTGAVRITNTDQIVSRNGGNSANITMMYVDGADIIRIGSQSFATSAIGAVRFNYCTPANFPAAGAGLDGVFGGVESTNNRLVFYSNGARYYVAATGTF